jgi:Fur family ferric uptake transcriptional regulator
MERFRGHLEASGLKFTRQRAAIAKAFFGSKKSHLSLTEILGLARRLHPSVGYATVYRTMRLMSEGGLVTEHKFGEGQTQYELHDESSHHDHIICTKCGAIVEFEDEEIERLQRAIAERHGFRVVSHRHEVYGDCLRANCQNGLDSPAS